MRNGESGQAENIGDLLLSIQSGSSGAFVQLSELYEPLLTKEVSRYAESLGSADLEDLRQAAFISLYRAALAYRADRGVTFGLFAKVCIVNGIADTLRYIGKKPADVCIDQLADDLVAVGSAGVLCADRDLLFCALQTVAYAAHINGDRLSNTCGNRTGTTMTYFLIYGDVRIGSAGEYDLVIGQILGKAQQDADRKLIIQKTAF